MLVKIRTYDFNIKEHKFERRDGAVFINTRWIINIRQDNGFPEYYYMYFNNCGEIDMYYIDGMTVEALLRAGDNHEE